MALPPYSNDVRWKRYEIDTPTFRLNPVEKPDMSPYLVHMTGKKAIAAILRGEGARSAPPQDHGYLLAAIPEHSARDPLGGQGAFGAEVVCFTESPTFALDFFRYRSFRRWRDDQRFGIGFSKEQLVHRGVRPVLYADDDLTRDIIAAYHEVQDRDGRICDDPALNERLNEILRRAYPLLFPLLETAGAQGFMWEREWRYPDAEGLAFSFDEIEVICCPPDEELDIRRLLGAHADHVRFVRSWQEYDDVTDYLGLDPV